MSEYQLSAGDYPGMKYWSVTRSNNRLLIRPGRVPWGSILLVEAVLGGLGLVILGFLGHDAPEDRWLFVLTCFPIGIAVLGCFLVTAQV